VLQIRVSGEGERRYCRRSGFNWRCRHPSETGGTSGDNDTCRSSSNNHTDGDTRR